MQKWEYLRIVCRYSSSGFHPWYVGDEEVPNWKNQRTNEYCNKLGDEGWEMVNAAISMVFTSFANVDGNDSRYDIYFKRPKA